MSSATKDCLKVLTSLVALTAAYKTLSILALRLWNEIYEQKYEHDIRSSLSTSLRAPKDFVMSSYT